MILTPPNKTTALKGSPSIVGVERQTKGNKGSWERERTAPLNVDRAENSSTEISEISISERNALQYFDFVIDPFCEAVGVRAIERIEYVGFPVLKYLEERIKLFQSGNIRMQAKFSKPLFGLQRVGGTHEVIEPLLQQICLSQFMGHQEHLFNGSLVFIREIFHMRKKELSAALEVFALFREQFLLKVLSDLLNRPGTVANNMEPINDDRSIRKQIFCDRKIFSVHIHHEVLHLFSVGKFPQIVGYLRVIARREDINNPSVNWVGQDTLKLTVLCVAAEFINGKDSGQLSGLPVFQQIHPAANRRFGDPERIRDLLSRLFLSQLIDSICCQTIRNAVPPRQ